MAQQQKPLGLVLSELVLVILIVGILAVTVATQFRGTFDANAQALALYNTTQKMAANWNQFAATCGAKSDVLGSPLLATSNNTATAVLTRGPTAVNSQFQKCYHQSNVRLLTDAIQQAGSGPQVQGYRFDLSGGGMAPFVATFHAVPAELTYVLASRYGSLKTASLLPQDTRSLHVRYQPDGKNTYAVQILVGSPTQLAAAPTLIGTTPLSGPAAPPPTGTSNPPTTTTTPPTTMLPPPGSSPTTPVTPITPPKKPGNPPTPPGNPPTTPSNPPSTPNNPPTTPNNPPTTPNNPPTTTASNGPPSISCPANSNSSSNGNGGSSASSCSVGSATSTNGVATQSGSAISNAPSSGAPTASTGSNQSIFGSGSTSSNNSASATNSGGTANSSTNSNFNFP